MISLDLPLPPSVNALYRNVPGRGRAKTQAYRTWENAAGWEVRAQAPQPIAGPVVMRLTFQWPDRRRRDVSNYVKATEDLLVEHKLIEDDSECARRCSGGASKGGA
jgi:crossover junction endodeoxyribonuclease RusA